MKGDRKGTDRWTDKWAPQASRATKITIPPSAFSNVSDKTTNDKCPAYRSTYRSLFGFHRSTDRSLSGPLAIFSVHLPALGLQRKGSVALKGCARNPKRNLHEDAGEKNLELASGLPLLVAGPPMELASSSPDAVALPSPSANAGRAKR